MMTEPSEWIKRNMMGTYSEKLGRPLTEAELRVQRCLEQLVIPDWYKKYSRPSNILKNCTPFECRPPSWKSINAKQMIPPGKTLKNKSPKNTPKKLQPLEISFCNTVNQEEDSKNSNSIYGVGYKNVSSKFPKFLEISSEQKDTNYCRTNSNSNSYPRVNRSRKIENINIVFPREKQPGATPQSSASAVCRTTYTMTKSWSLVQESQCSMSPSISNSHASFLIAEVKPSGVSTRLCAFTEFEGLEENNLDPYHSSSTSTYFINSSKKLRKLKYNLHSELQDTWPHKQGLIQEIINELNQNPAIDCLTSENSHAQFLVRSIINALENKAYNIQQDTERCFNTSSDSNLSKSTDISLKLYDSMEESLSTPTLYDEEKQEDEPYWIPCKVYQLPRTSSLLSMLSRVSSRNSYTRSNSPDLSPIKREYREDYVYQQQQQQPPTLIVRPCRLKFDKAARQLFKIDETGIADSGYSDKSDAASSKMSSHSFDDAIKKLPTISLESTSCDTFESSVHSRRMLKRSSPYVLKSFYV